MNKNSEAIKIFCCQLLNNNTKPLNIFEWSSLADLLMNKKLEPKDLIDFTFDELLSIGLDIDFSNRLLDLRSKSSSIIFELDKLYSKNINIVTRADSSYPKKLKKKLGKKCPPLFYYVGDLNLLDKEVIGFVGSRNITDDDILFNTNIVNKVIEKGYGVVSGGAIGVDSISKDIAIQKSFCIEYLGDSLNRKIKDINNIKAIKDNKLLLLSFVNPDAPFNVGNAMKRNEFIYSQSEATIIIKSDYQKGGTWNGAISNLKNNYTKSFCWDNKKYKGNQMLIQNGCIPIDETFDGNINDKNKKPIIEQNSLF